MGEISGVDGIPGLGMLPGFALPAECAPIMKRVDAHEWDCRTRRRVQHHCYRYDYRSRSIDASMRAEDLSAWRMHMGCWMLGAGRFPAAPDQVIVNEYLFALRMAFQLPVLLSLLSRVGIVTAGGLTQYRRHAYVGMFVIAAILAPPDIIAKTGHAVPLILLYEISNLSEWLIARKEAKAEAGA